MALKLLQTLTHKRYISREETNFQRGGAVKKVKTWWGNVDSCSITVEPSPGPSVCTRSQLGKFSKEKCFFCQEDVDKLILNACRSKDRGKNIAEIVKNSNNDSWKANLAEVISAGDLLTKNIVYHHLCYTQNWKNTVLNKRKTLKIMT